MTEKMLTGALSLCRPHSEAYQLIIQLASKSRELPKLHVKGIHGQLADRHLAESLIPLKSHSYPCGTAQVDRLTCTCKLYTVADFEWDYGKDYGSYHCCSIRSSVLEIEMTITKGTQPIGMGSYHG